MPIEKSSPSPLPYGVARREQLLKSFYGTLTPVETEVTYKLALFCAAVTMLLLPLLYLSLIGLTSYAVYWHAVENLILFQKISSKRMAAFLYVAPLFVGVVLVFFLVKPLLAPRAQESRKRTLRPQDEPILHAFVEKLCATVGAPMPSRIQVDCEINASAGLRRGFRSLFGRKDLVLTVGLPLVEGLTLDQLAGVLAHEFGHFAQGAGMRLSYVVRSINFWFARVVHGRDQWDEQLKEAAQTNSGGIAMAVGLARGAVWLSRKILAGLMFVGHAISCYLMRQMEFDADRYETRLVGAEVFESTSREMNYLGAAWQRSIHDISISWNDGHLVDNLPRLVANHRRQIEPDLLAKISESVQQSKTSFFDTHPADHERIQSARKEKGAPILRTDFPAEVLFRDLATLSRQVSKAFYEEQLESEIDATALVPIETLLARQSHLRADLQSFGRLLGLPFDIFEPPLPRLASEAPDAASALARLAEIRREQQQNAEELEKVSSSYDELSEESIRLQGAQLLIDAEVPLAKGAFGLDDASQTGVTNRQIKVRNRLEELRPAISRGLDLATERTALAAGLLDDPRLTQNEEAPALRSQLEELLPLASALANERQGLHYLRLEISNLRTIAKALGEGLAKPEKTTERFTHSASLLAEEVKRLRHALEGLPYPFENAQADLSLGAFLVPELPLPSDAAACHDAAMRALQLAQSTGARIWGRLASTIEKIESLSSGEEREARVAV